jgi:hypothetical protein
MADPVYETGNLNVPSYLVLIPLLTGYTKYKALPSQQQQEQQLFHWLSRSERPSSVEFYEEAFL